MGLGMQSLIDKLNPTCRNGLETAAQLCVSQTNYYVEIEHYLVKLLDQPGSDLHRILRYYEVRTSDLMRELTLAMDRFKRGNALTPALSSHIILLLEQSWLLTTLRLDSGSIRSGAVILALLDHDTLYGLIIGAAPSLKKIPRAAVDRDLVEIVRAEKEESAGRPLKESSALAPDSPSAGFPALEQFTIDLTAQAANGFLDPIFGREMEIRRIVDILTRRRQNNPLLTGEAGVGKTAVVEGLALKIASGQAPPALKNVSIRLLDLGLLQAGAGIRGEFEKRLKEVIDEVKGSPRPIILFIDEAHTMIGAGGPAGLGDAANLLKPALARGELRTIAATTWGEYKKYIEKDPALARRFQVVKIEEPDEETAVRMLRAAAAGFEKHHRVKILDSAVREAVRLSLRYIPGRQEPEKAVSLLDTACARAAVARTVTPPAIEDLAVRISQLEMERTVLKKEEKAGRDHTARLGELKDELERLGLRQTELREHWAEERRVVERFFKLEQNLEKLEAEHETDPDYLRLISELARTREELDILQSEGPMVPARVDPGIIAAVVSDWTGIPVGRMMADEIDTVLNLKEKLESRIIGQSPALEVICRRIRTYRAGLDDPEKPVGVFLLTGPSGVGKTETASALAEILYGGEGNLTLVNMSEYQEAYTVSGLKGSPPGYVGHGQGGVLTEAIRHNPYTVLLLDEVEKAHPDVMELFYQVFDKGRLEDSDGLTVDFRNTLILLTSNLGADIIRAACQGAGPPPDPGELAGLIRPGLLKRFHPALLGRLVVVPYQPLDDQVIRSIVELKLEKIKRRFAENQRIELTWDPEAAAAVTARCREVDAGARNVDHVLTQVLLPELSAALLKRMARGLPCLGIHVFLDRSGRFAYRFDPPSDEDPVPDKADTGEKDSQSPASDAGPGEGTAGGDDEAGPPDPSGGPSRKRPGWLKRWKSFRS